MRKRNHEGERETEFANPVSAESFESEDATSPRVQHKLSKLRPVAASASGAAAGGAFENETLPRGAESAESWATYDSMQESGDYFQGAEDDAVEAAAMMRFKELDSDGSGVLDRKQIAVVLNMMSQPDDDEAVDDMLTQMWKAGGEQGSIEEVRPRF
jgi:hypothetical protein